MKVHFCYFCFPIYFENALFVGIHKFASIAKIRLKMLFSTLWSLLWMLEGRHGVMILDTLLMNKAVMANEHINKYKCNTIQYRIARYTKHNTVAIQ